MHRPTVRRDANYALTAVLIAALFASGCTPRTEQGATQDAASVRSQLDTMWAGLAVAMTAGDTASVARFYTDSAYFAETGSPTTRGRAAIVAATANVFRCCVYRESRQQIERTDLAGNTALQYGTYRDVIEPKGQSPLALFGRFDAVLERDSANAWRISRLVVIRDSMIKRLPRTP